MNKKEISALVTYNFWANQRLLRACERLSTSKFIRTVTPDPGWGSLRGILVHIMDAEYGWRSEYDSDVLVAHTFADVAAVSSRWSEEEEKWFEYLAELPEETLNKHIDEDDKGKSKLWQAIVHIVNYGTQHRGEAAAILTGYGKSPGELEFDLFLRENPQYI